MKRDEALSRLRAREPEPRALGIEAVSLFGSTARDEARADSDLDLAVRFHPGLTFAWGWYWTEDEVAAMLGAPVDRISEPSGQARLQAQIDRDRVSVF